MKFTYLDLVDKTILFDPVIARNWFFAHENSYEEGYSLFTIDETKPYLVPGYHAKRCIIEVEMALALSCIQKEILPQGLCLKVYDAYRPQKAVSFFTQWTTLPDTEKAKRLHYPHVSKKNLHELSYLSRTSSHSKGTAVDVTLVSLHTHRASQRPAGFLGYFDVQSLDMGIGYLGFDEKAWHEYQTITDEQKRHKEKLLTLMMRHNFEPLSTEFWHYYYKPSRNLETYFDFDIREDYLENTLLGDEREFCSNPQIPKIPKFISSFSNS